MAQLQSVARSPRSSSALRQTLDKDPEADLARPRQLSADAELLATTPISSFCTDTGALPAFTATSSLTTPSCALRVDSSSNTCPAAYEPSADEAKTYLDLFRSQMLRHFAFIHIAPNQTAQQLHRDRPFLFHAIVAVASPSKQQKVRRGSELKRVLAQKALLENQSSVDLLLGLLTYVAWGYDLFLSSSGTLSRLMMLAVSLVYDLRLNKPLPLDAHNIGLFLPGFEGCYRGASEEMGQSLLERQRAVLGCFLLSSIVSSYFAHMDAMQWTPHMEECLRAVSANNECPTDEAFAFQVRLQLLAQRATRVREQQQMNHAVAAKPGTPLPTSLYFRALQGQLQQLRQSLCPELQQQEILLAHVHYVEIHINETTYTANSDAPLFDTLTASKSISSSSTHGFDRLECLWLSVNAIKSWLDIFLTLSPSTCRGFSFISWAQLARCLVILYRLSVLEDPAWDRQAVRNTVDLMPLLDRIGDKFELVSQEAGELSSEDPFLQLSRMARMFRAGIMVKMATEQALEESIRHHHGSASCTGANLPDQNPMATMQPIDFGNERWLEDFLADFR